MIMYLYLRHISNPRSRYPGDLVSRDSSKHTQTSTRAKQRFKKVTQKVKSINKHFWKSMKIFTTLKLLWINKKKSY